MTTKSSLAERLMRGILRTPMGTDGAGVMFRRLDSEERVWLMADYAYVTAIFMNYRQCIVGLDRAFGCHGDVSHT